MAVASTVLKTKSGTNFKTLFAQHVLSGNYTQVTGESVNLKGSALLNPGARTVIGPEGAALPFPPRLSFSAGGYIVTLDLASGSTYTLRVWTSGGTELATGAYPAALLAATITTETDFEAAG